MKHITLHGRLGKDAMPTSKGNDLTFTLAVTDDVDKTKTDWFTCYYSKVDLAKYLTKGKEVILSGRLYFSNKENKTYFNVSVEGLKFLHSGSKVSKETSDVADKLPY